MIGMEYKLLYEVNTGPVKIKGLNIIMVENVERYKATYFEHTVRQPLEG